MKNTMLISGIIVGTILLFLSKKNNDNKILKIIGTVLLVICISFYGI